MSALCEFVGVGVLGCLLYEVCGEHVCMVCGNFVTVYTFPS